MSTKIKKNKKGEYTLEKIFAPFVFSCAPIATFAATALAAPTDLTMFVNNFLTVLNNAIIPFLAGLSILAFLTGVLKYVGAGGDEERLSKGKQLIIYGLLGLLVLFSFWGLAVVVANTFSFGI